MPARLLRSFDPLVRLLLLAILLASVLPVRGEGREIAQYVSNAAVFLLFFLNGVRLPREQVLRGLAHMRFLLPLTLWCFGGMALAGWGISALGTGLLPPTVALGFLFLGTLPSTVQSATAYSSIAGGNVANSVVAAAMLNILGVFVTAPLFALLAGSQSAGFGIDGLTKVAAILLLPFALGQIAQIWAKGWVVEHKQLVTWMDRASIAIAVYVAFSSAVDQGIWTRISAQDWVAMLALVLVMLVVGFGGSWALGGRLGLARDTRISFLFAGGQKSIAMGAPLATVLFAPSVAGVILLPVLVYHLLQLVLSAPLANRLNR